MKIDKKNDVTYILPKDDVHLKDIATKHIIIEGGTLRYKAGVKHTHNVIMRRGRMEPDAPVKVKKKKGR